MAARRAAGVDTGAETRIPPGRVFMTRPVTSHSVAQLADACAAIARAPDLTRAVQETAQQTRRLLRCDAVAIQLAAEAGDGPAPLAYSVGYEDEKAIAKRLATPLKTGAVVGRGEGWVEIATPLRGEDHSHGSVVARIRVSAEKSSEQDARETLAALARLLGASLDRIDRARAAEHRMRMEAGGDMATSIGHSLRHALYGISSAAQLLRFRASDDPVLEKNVGRLLKEADRVSRLVDSLLDFGRPVTLDLSLADPDDAWDEVIASHRGQLESRSLAVTRTRSAGASRAVDVRRLGQAFSLLLEGAAERAPAASDLQLVSELTAGGAWRSRLTFAGSVDQAELQKLFDPLTGTNAGQAGVSLALSRRIVDAHGGSLDVFSHPGEGTTMTVLLPA